MLQRSTPEDFVVATGEQRSVREFVEVAAECAGIKLRWSGQGVEEKGYDRAGNCVVAVDPRYFRPTEVETLLGDCGKAREKLGWHPRTSFAALVDEMMKEDLKEAECEELLRPHGFPAVFGSRIAS
jgi:GDPmannose 4,6-dehydratase